MPKRYWDGILAGWMLVAVGTVVAEDNPPPRHRKRGRKPNERSRRRAIPGCRRSRFRC